MKIEEIKTTLVENVQELVTDTAKDELIVFLATSVMPQVKEVADAYTDKLKESSKDESGWNKFRDQAFLPFLITVSLQIVDKLLNKMAA